jgi:hypothetical protein
LGSYEADSHQFANATSSSLRNRSNQIFA